MGQPGRGTNGDHKDIMSLAGLLDILDDDSQLRDVVARAAPTRPIPTWWHRHRCGPCWPPR